MPLNPGWEAKVSAIKPRVYFLGNKARQLIDKTLDEMHRFGRPKFTSEHTSLSFPVFVVWKLDAESRRNGKAVVNIQKLNEMILLDSYPLLLRSKIITNVQGFINLVILDVASFFYQ